MRAGIGHPGHSTCSAEPLESRRLLAVTPYFGIGTESSGAFSGVAGAAGVFYYADGGNLWRSDGTAAGTRVVKSFNHVTGGFANVNGTVYFAAADTTHSVEIWKTDGTANGTVLVKDAIPGATVYGVDNLTALGTRLLYTHHSGTQLWASDGTSGGTILLRDFGGGFIQNVVTSGGRALFTVGGGQLWRTDGTAAGTVQVATATGGNFRNLVDAGGTVYFVGPNGLWKAAGASGGASLVKNMGSAFLYNFGAANGKAFFVVDGRLWRSDGTDAGTIAVGPANGQAGELTALGTSLYFSNTDATRGAELWKSDGTVAGTVLVKDINPGAGSSSPFGLVDVGGSLMFTAASGATSGQQLWRSDGTATGTTLVKGGFRVGGNEAKPIKPSGVAGKVYLYADDGVHGSELWKSDGTAGGTVMVLDANLRPAGAVPQSPIAFNGKLFFAASLSRGGDGTNLWQTDGTAAGTTQITNFPMTASEGFVSDLTLYKGKLYFAATTQAAGRQLYRTDGTAAGTVMVTSPASGGAVSSTAAVTVSGGWLYFVASDPAVGAELWRTDGTSAPARVADINPGAAASTPSNLTNVNGTLFFSANDGVNGAELWRSDGTAAGTRMVRDLLPGALGSTPSQLTVVDGVLNFASAIWTTDPANPSFPPRPVSSQLWRSDGTATGTVLVKDFPGFSSARAVRLNGRMIFGGSAGGTGLEPWVTDGTAAGTVLLKDVNPGSAASLPTSFTVVGNTVYFLATDPTAGQELWKTDGTPAGTVRVKDLRAGATGSSAVGLANVGGTLYFTADDGVNGWSLWRTDGTDAGTTQFAGPVQGFGPVVLGTVGRDVYGQVGGFTLWKQTPADAVAPTVVGRSFDFQGGPHGVVLEFSEDVSASLAAADLVVTPIDGGATIAPAATALAYDPRNNAAALTFPGLAGGRLPDGNYRVTAAGGGVTDAAGNPLVAFTFDFFVLAGDANRDRVVNFDDLLTLAKNYNGAAKTYAEGDFDGNGTVNFDDLLVLAKNYNKVLPEPVTAPSASPTFGSAVAGATSEVLAGGNVAVFSTTPVDKPAAKPRPTPPYKPAGASATSKKPALTRQI